MFYMQSKTMTESPSQTVNISSRGNKEQTSHNLTSTKFLISTITDKGNGKQENQDNLLIRSGETALGYSAFLAVADGVGGMECGAKASFDAIKCLKQWWEEDLKSIMYTDVENIQYLINESLSAAVCKANKEIYETGLRENRKMATTLSAVFILNEWYCVKHVGDSRVYLLSDRIKQITEDHNLLNQHLKSGSASEIQCSYASLNNVLTKCLGIKADVEIFEQSGRMTEKEGMLLCTDGLYKRLSITEIARDIGLYRKHADDMQQGLKQLINKARKRGEQDDISAVLLTVKKRTIIFWPVLTRLIAGRRKKC